MAHSHHLHREHQVSHRRVHHILKGEPDGAKEHHKSHAFSKVTSKTAAEHHDGKVSGHRGAKRYARGGKVKKAEGGDIKPIKPEPAWTPQSGPGSPKPTEQERRDRGDPVKRSGYPRYARGGKTKGKGHQTNIAVVVPPHHPSPPMPGGAAAGAPPPGAPVPPPMAGPPPGMPPGMPPPPMRKRGGKVHIDGESSKGNIKKWGKRAAKNSYARGGKLPTAGAATGVARLEQFHDEKRRRK